MNPEEPRGSERDLTPHRLAPEPEHAQQAESDDALTTLVGFVGRSPVEGKVRVYLDLSFASYCEVATDDIVRTKRVDPADQDSPTTVWMKSSARIGMVSVGRLAGNASFVTGAIRARYRRPHIGLTPKGRVTLDCWRESDVVCPPPETRYWCISVDVPCPSNHSCPSDPMWCGPDPDPIPPRPEF